MFSDVETDLFNTIVDGFPYKNLSGRYILGPVAFVSYFLWDRGCIRNKSYENCMHLFQDSIQ